MSTIPFTPTGLPLFSYRLLPHRTAYLYFFLPPFGASDNHLPLEAMCRTIEIDLRTALGERDFPPPLLPLNYRPS